jgi:SMC interacting uncharacterized protein involved in chromosome segregation
MFDRINPFKKGRSANPLDGLKEDELRAARKKLEFSRERTLRQILDLENQKVRLLEAGAQSELRVRRDLAYQVKDAEEQIRQLDHQRDALAKQIQFISRLSFLKQNSEQVGKLVVDQLMGKVDTGELRNYIEEISVRGTAGADRLNELVEMFDQSWVAVRGVEEDPELSRILEEMERRSIASLPEIGVHLDTMETPDGTRNSERSNPF